MVLQIIQSGPKKSLWCDLEEKCLWNSKIFFDGVFLSIYSHLQEVRALELFDQESWMTFFEKCPISTVFNGHT